MMDIRVQLKSQGHLRKIKSDDWIKTDSRKTEYPVELAQSRSMRKKRYSKDGESYRQVKEMRHRRRHSRTNSMEEVTR